MDKKVEFNLAPWLVVFLKVTKRILSYLTILGVGGAAVESQFQFKPLATLIFVLLREGITELMSTYVKQSINDDDK